MFKDYERKRGKRDRQTDKQTDVTMFCLKRHLKSVPALLRFA